MTYFLFTSQVLPKCQYLKNTKQILVRFNQNDLQIESFQIYATGLSRPSAAITKKAKHENKNS